MQRRVDPARFSGRLTLAVCLALPLLPVATLAQTPPTDSSVITKPLQEEQPQLLLVIRRDPKATPRDEAARTTLQDAILALVRNSGRYQVTFYSPTNALVKRALLDHAISSIDLAEPLQPEGMRHLAIVLGIRTILFVTPTIDKTGLKMESQLHQNLGRDAWQLGATDQINTDFQYGKRRLNTKEIVALSVDGLGARLNMPSHLAADLNLQTAEAVNAKLDKADQARAAAAARAAEKNKPKPPTNAEKRTTAVANEGDPQVPVAVKPDGPRLNPTREVKPPVLKPDKTPKVTKRADTPPPIADKPNSSADTNAQGGGVGRGDVPTVQTTVHPNYETLSDHYHDNKDLANTITFLRYAVNERPRDVSLRRKLILAYQEHKMPETALAEITRALQIAPNEGSFYRAYGETLMTKGEVPGAQKAFREAIRLNAADIQARIALGDALMLDNQYPEALEAYAAAQKADVRSPLPHRRLARVLLLRASADPTQYAASLEEIGKARELIPKGDTASYQEDYGTLMQISEARLRELLEELSANFIALNKGAQSGNDTLRALSDIQVRTDAVSAYLDKAPSAVGQDATQVHYQQAAALLLQSVTLLRSYLNKNESNVKQQMQDAQAEAHHELDTAHKRLAEIRAALSTK
jgi:tetratricopeptide (TPR) repeat protein